MALTPALSCRRPPAIGFNAFVANEEGRSVAVVDLTTFRVIRQIGIDGAPKAGAPINTTTGQITPTFVFCLQAQ